MNALFRSIELRGTFSVAYEKCACLDHGFSNRDTKDRFTA